MACRKKDVNLSKLWKTDIILHYFFYIIILHEKKILNLDKEKIEWVLGNKEFCFWRLVVSDS